MITRSKLVATILICLALPVMGCVSCVEKVVPPSPENTTSGTNNTPESDMSIRGIVHDYQSGSTVGSVEIKLYTYKKPDLLPQLPPIGDVIATTVTDEQGRYQFEVQFKTLPQDCDKLVVFVDTGTEGYQAINVAPGMIQVNLTRWSPALTRNYDHNRCSYLS